MDVGQVAQCRCKKDDYEFTQVGGAISKQLQILRSIVHKCKLLESGATGWKLWKLAYIYIYLLHAPTLTEVLR